VAEPIARRTLPSHQLRAPRWRQRIRYLGAATLVALVLCAWTPAPNWIAGFVAVPSLVAPADAIVVLGGGVRNDNSLSDESMRRFVRGVSLYKEGLAPTLVLLGPSSRGRTRAEAEVRADMARVFGVPNEALLTFTRAYTTRNEAMSTAELLASRHAKNIVLVTGSIHMRRARLAFEKEGFIVRAGTSDNDPDTSESVEDRLKLTVTIIQETVALIYYRVAGYI
jgi:uncharacterized SAM-binding protein YcdF (DUF218 family)